MDVQLLRPTDSSHHANVMMRSGGGPTPGNMGPNMPHFRKGGRACHAEGDIVATPMRKGGRSHKRHRHADGGMEAMHRMGMDGHGIRNNMNDNPFYAEGGKTETLRKGGRTHRHRHAEGGEESDKMRKGGRSHKRHRHAEGDKVEMMRHGGSKKKV